MKWLDNLILKAASSITSSLDLWKHVYGGRQSSSGITVTVANALEFSVCVAAVRTICNGFSQVPFCLLQEVSDKRTKLNDTPLGYLVYRKPNKLQTSFEWRSTVMLHLLMANNAFNFVGRVGRAREVREIRPIEPNRMRVVLEKDDKVRYFVRGDNGEEMELPAEAIWHIKGMSWSPHLGLDGLKMMRNALGLGMAIEDTAATLNKNGLQTSGVLAMEGKLQPAQFEFFSGWLDKHLPGGERFQKPLVADMNSKWYPMSMTGVDAQHLESRKFQIEEICRQFNIMPIMVGHADKTATYASAEQMFIAHVVHCLAPRYELFEQSANAYLLSDDQRKEGMYFKFFPDGLLRGDIASRYSAYAKALGSGGGVPWLTLNEVRAYQDLDGIGPEGDKIDKPVKPEPAPNADPKKDEDKTALELFAKADVLRAETGLREANKPPPIFNVDARTTVHPPAINVKMDAPQVEVHPPEIKIAGTHIDVHIPRRGDIVKKVTATDSNGRITEMTEKEID